MGKLAFFKFYPGDWTKDPGIQTLTLEERGAWIEILLLMHNSEQRGKLILNGNPYPMLDLAIALRSTENQIKQILSKLVANGVAKLEQNVITCKRMIEEQELWEKRANAGRKGGASTQAKLKQKGEDSRLQTPDSRLQTPEKEEDISCDVATSNGHIAGRLEAIRLIWEEYLTKLGKNPKILTLTALRKNKGLARLSEALKKTGGDLDKSKQLMSIAIESLSKSDWHMGRDPKTGGKKYDSWENNLFRNSEQFEKWLEQS